MKRLITLLTILIMGANAQALKLVIWDDDMTTKLGAGESLSGRLVVQLVKGYEGSARIIFSQSPEEKKLNLFAGLQNSYFGQIKNAYVGILDTERSPNTGVVDLGQPLQKLMQPYKIQVLIQPIGNGPDRKP